MTKKRDYTSQNPRQSTLRIERGYAIGPLKITPEERKATAHVAYLVRYAEAFGLYWLASLNGAVAWYYQDLLLQNVGTPPFGFWQGYVQTVSNGPTACAFAYNGQAILTNSVDGSIEVAYVGSVPAGGTKTITLTYRDM